MQINSNFEVGVNSINEFTRVLVPEAYNKNIVAKYEYVNNNIVLYSEVEGVNGVFQYENLEHIIDDQKIVMFKAGLMHTFKKYYPWGGLIGVRPTKVIKKLLNLGINEEKAIEILIGLYQVSREKANLLLTIYNKEIKPMNREAISIYIGVPFCPTKCRYCSFASYEIGSPVGKYYPVFVETLLKEIELAGALIKEKKLKVESIYIGGGTPSVLTENDLERVLHAVELNIDKSSLREYTFEAGREDCITVKKLELAKKYGVDRVSLNPQTFNLETLAKLNRKLNQENFDFLYKEMKRLGFIINMDLILGLPGEDETDIVNTLDKIQKYDIENLTIHSLALKKASVLYKDSDAKISDMSREKVEAKVRETLKAMRMEPYYIYRQKNSADWGENIGYAKPGFESIFNIEMIEENQSTLGLGGGAITKKITPSDTGRDDIVRVVNPKEPATYAREMEERFKEKILLF